MTAARNLLASWAARINAPSGAFERPGTHVVVAAEQRTDRVLLYRTPDVSIAVLPAAAGTEADRLATQTTALTAQDVIRLVPNLRLGLRWRDRIYHLPPERAAMTDHPHIHGLAADDAAALADLQAACSERERGWAQISIDDPFAVGWWDQERLLGAASLLFPAAGIADVGVLVRPPARRRGIASQLVRQIARLAVHIDRVAQYTAPETNAGSVAVAERCGFALTLVEEGLQTDW